MVRCTNTPIQEFYKDKVVFITGGSGFVGKGIIEKLLRSCPDIQKIYLLLRNKKGKNADERIKELFSGLFFEKLMKKNPRFQDKIAIMNGDLLKDNLGLAQEEINILVNDVDIVFHVAATVRFDEALRIATQINIISTKKLLELCKQSQRLKAIVHVSTAYSNCIRSEIDEKFYTPLRDPDEFIEFVRTKSDEELDALKGEIIQDYPNTYTFTKGLAEEILRRDGKGLPLAIIRPSIILGAWNEPIRGWVDNLFGPMGLLAGTGYGLVHIIYMTPNKYTDIIPLDMTVNSIIAAAWKTAQNPSKEESSIYNVVIGKSNPILWKDYFAWCQRFAAPYMPAKAISIVYAFSVTSVLQLNICKFFLHTIPGTIADTFLRLQGKKPIIMKLYDKIHKTYDLLSYFSINQWKFHDDNTRKLFFSLDETDQLIFPFDVKEIEWDLFIAYNIRAVRTFIMKDPLHTITEGQWKQNKIFGGLCIVFALFLYFIYYMFAMMYDIIF